MTDETVPNTETITAVAIPLGRRSRILCGTLGTIGTTSGAIAVFVSSNGAGTLALIVVGVALLLVGLSGVMPTRLKVGDNEVQWQAQQRVEAAASQVREVLNEAPPEVGEELATRLTEEATHSPNDGSDPILSVAKSYLYEQRAHEALNRVLPQVPGYTLVRPAIREPDKGAEAILTTPDGRTIVFQVKNLTTYSSSRLRMPLGQLARRVNLLGAYAGVLIVPSDHTVRASGNVQVRGTNARVEVVAWKNESDDSALLSTIEALSEQ